MIQLVAILTRRITLISCLQPRRCREVVLIHIRNRAGRLLPKLLRRVVPIEIRRFLLHARQLPQPHVIHHRANRQRVRTNVARVHQKILRRPSLLIPSQLIRNTLDRHHLCQLIRAIVHHCNVIIGSLAGLHLAFVLDVPVAIIGPHRRHLRRNLQVSLLRETRPLLPQVGNELRVRMHGPHDLHLFLNRVADPFPQQFVVALDARIHRCIARIREPTQTHIP